MKRRSLSSFVLFDVTYVDGSRSSNRKVLSSALEGIRGRSRRCDGGDRGAGSRDRVGVRTAAQRYQVDPAQTAVNRQRDKTL